MKVRMNVTISGGRADGRPWPHAGEELEVGDAEGADLVRGGMAENVTPEPEPVPEAAKPEPEPEVETREDKAPEPEVSAPAEETVAKRGPGRPRKQ